METSKIKILIYDKNDPFMSYRILSSNVILGGGSIPEYALVAAPDGALQIERLDGNAAVLDVDGNLECEHLTLTSLTPENRVVTTDPAGRLIVTGFDADGLGNASALTSGTLPGDRLQGGSYTFANLTTTGGVTAGSLVANINAANIISGILPAGRLVGDYNFGNLTLSNTLTAATLAANISADNLTSGTLSDDRLSGPYAFGSLTLTGNLDAAWVNANLSATNLVTGVLDPARLQGSYTFDTLTVSNVLTANAVEIPTLLGSNVLVSDGTGTITTSNVTQTELAYLSGVVSPVQTQINELGNGNIVGSNITNLDANNLTFGVVPDDRLQGAYAFDSLTLTGSLVANSVSGNLDASQLVSGVVPSQRLAGSYAVTNLTASGTVTAGTVSGNLNASQLVSGTVPASRLAGGSYSFTSLDLTGNLDAGTINANVDAASLVSGTVDNVRLDLEGLVTNVTPALTNLTLGTPSNAWSHVHATTVHVDDVELGNAIMYNGNAVVVDLEQTTRSIVAAGPEYTIGTQTTPWSNVYAANVLVGNVILSGSLLNSNLETYLDLSNVATNVNPATAGLTIGTVDRPWTNVVATSANVQTFAVIGNVTSDLVPATDGLDLGTSGQRWGNLYADHLYANVDAADIYGELDANIVFTGGSIDDFVIKAPAGTAAQPGLRFTDDDQTGFFLPAPGTMGLSCGNATALTLDASTMTVSGNVVPGANASYDLGNAAVAWRDVHIANALHAGPVTIAGGSVTGVADLDVSGNLDAGNVVATGTVSGSTLVGNLDAASLTGTIDPARISGDYAVSNLTITGDATVAGTTTIQPSGHILPQSNLVYDLGSSTNVWRDLYLAGSTIHLGNATIHEETGNVVISKMKITGSIVADGLLPDMSISNVQITDTNWTVVDDTAISTDGGKFLLNGSGFGPGCLCQVGGVNASSTSYVSPAQLRVEVGARATGTYPITVVRGDTQIATLPSGLTYSNAVTWITSSTLGNVVYGQSFTIPLVATSDSSVWYANVTSLPADTTLDPITGNLSGNITSVTTSTLFAFDVDAVDQELQDARRSFLLQLLVLLINGATYTDASWNALTQTALDANSGSVYFTVDGTGMNEVTDVFVGGTPATSFVALDTSTLRVTAPEKPRGTYNVMLQWAGGTKVLPNGVFYSDVPVFTTAANLGVVEWNTQTTLNIQTQSDSNVIYSNTSPLPSGITLNPSTGDLMITPPSYTLTPYSITIRSIDEELQESTETFSISTKSDILSKLQLSANTSTVNTTGTISTIPGSINSGFPGYAWGLPINMESGNVFIPINNSTSPPYIYNPDTKTFSATSGIPGNLTNYASGCLLRDGRIMLFKSGGNQALLYTETTNSWELTTPSLEFGIQLFDGRIFSRPYNGYYTLYDLDTDTAVQRTTTIGNAIYMVLLNDGRVFGHQGLSSGYIYDPYTDSFTDVSSVLTPFNLNTDSSHSSVLLSDGRVFIAPYSLNNSAGAVIYDPFTNTATMTPNFPGYGDGAVFYGSVLLPDGRVFVIRYINGTKHAIYNPFTNTVSSLTSSYMSFGGCVMKNGNLLITPLNNGTDPFTIFTPDSIVPNTWVTNDSVFLSPHVNSSYGG